MRCSGCGTINEASRRFCIECGNRLVAGCPNCGTENPPGAKFCGECGTALSAAAGSPGQPTTTAADSTDERTTERRLVSVLFADLVGFTPFSEERDPEEVRETLSVYFDRSREVIERYGGTVEKFIGDAVMAVWGTPVTHEDDAERAVRAAVELVDAVAAMDQGLQARVGVQTGDAAVALGAIGEGMVAGDLVNTTARIQAAARPGTVLVNEGAMQAASGAIAFEPAGEHALKGKAAPVALWRALRVVAERGGRGRNDGLEPPFVGRDTEFRLLKELFHDTGRERRVRMVSVSGQGGIGKSRLAWELEKYLDGLVEPVWWHHGRSPSYGSGITFWALGEMVRGRCGLFEDDDEATTRARVAETVERFVPDGPERARVSGALLTLLGVGSAATPSEQLFPAWRAFFEHIARQGTTLLVFEDLQWADPGLLAFIDHLVSWSHDLPICIVTLARPELLETHPEWGTGHVATAVPLAPLSRDSMEALLTGLVPGLPPAARDRIVDRAGGIPLYAVETVRMLLNDGRLVEVDGAYQPTADLATLEAPESLRALVASRLDTLDPDDRGLLQSAAVLGQTFSTEALAAVAGSSAEGLDERLRRLVRREMLSLRADPRSPERGQFAFAQELLREVAYETLARDDRRQRHLAAAGYFEGLDADELAGALAAQYQAAYRNTRPGPQADALAVQARRSLEGAAERALSLGSTEQAQRLFEGALELATEPADQARLLVAAGRAATHAGNGAESRRHLERAIEIYRETGERSLAALAIASLVDAVVQGAWQLEEARALARAAVEEFSDLGVDRGLVQLLAQLARMEMLVQEDLGAAVATADRALPMAERLDLAPVVADLLITRGTALASTGRGIEGLGAIEAGRRLAAAERLPDQEGRALLNMSGPLAERDPRAMLQASVAALDLARRTGSQMAASMAVNNIVEAARMTGDWDLALTELRAEAEVSRGNDLQRIRGSMTRLLAERGEADPEEVASLLDYVKEQIASGEPVWQHELDAFRADLALAAGRYRESAELFRANGEADPFNASASYIAAFVASALDGDAAGVQASLAGLERSGSHGAVVKLSQLQAQAYLDAAAGLVEASLDGFRTARDGFDQLGLAFFVAISDMVLCSTHDLDLPQVQAGAAEASAIFERLGAKPWLERLELLLAQAAGTPAPSGTSGVDAEARSSPVA